MILHYALILFIFSAAVLILVSKTGIPQPLAVLEQVTFQKKKEGAAFKWSTDVVLTVILVILVLILWTVFSSWGIA